MFKDLGSLMSLMGNRDKIQQEVARFQQTVGTITAEGTAGGGMVTVRVNGKLEILSCKIGDDAWKLNDREMLEDLVVAATNQALNKVREQLSAETQKMAANLGLPPGMLGGGLPGLG
jgi:DNA-binding YbaB/EbfC family protein